MTRLLLVIGSACLAMGTTWLLPIFFELSLGEPLSEIGRNVAWLGPAMLAAGIVLMAWGFRRPKPARLPGPVRMAITVNVLFLSFCSLEFSDGLVRQDGRLLYWTT